MRWRERLAAAAVLGAVAALTVPLLRADSPDRTASVSIAACVVFVATSFWPGRFATAVAVTVLSAAIIGGGVIASTLPLAAQALHLAVLVILMAMILLAAHRARHGDWLAHAGAFQDAPRDGEDDGDGDGDGHGGLAAWAGSRARPARDGLTGVLTRRAIEAGLSQQLARCRAAGETLGILLIDLDRFTTYNARYGHGSGDACLRRVAAMVSGEVRREADLVGRFAGDQFLVVLPDRDLAACIRVAQRVRRAVERAGIGHAPDGPPSSEPPVQTRPFPVTVSLGVAVAGPGADAVMVPEADALLRVAREHLAAAKASGRNRVTPAFVIAMGAASHDEA
jgi:diguanylate cyclase (GGDEF)-like protein